MRERSGGRSVASEDQVEGTVGERLARGICQHEEVSFELRLNLLQGVLHDSDEAAAG